MALPFPFVLATGNLDKTREILEMFVEATSTLVAAAPIEFAGRTCGFLVASGEGVAEALERLPELAREPDIEETGATLADNARIKAEGMRAATGLPAVADDTGLEVDALAGAPGVRSARYAGEDATYDDNVRALLRALDGVPERSRTARFVTVVHVAAADDGELVVRGEVEGHITGAPRGSGTFGYDPVFVPDEGDGRTFAEMAATEKHALSHRGRAIRALMSAWGVSSPDDQY